MEKQLWFSLSTKFPQFSESDAAFLLK